MKRMLFFLLLLVFFTGCTKSTNIFNETTKNCDVDKRIMDFYIETGGFITHGFPVTKAYNNNGVVSQVFENTMISCRSNTCYLEPLPRILKIPDNDVNKADNYDVHPQIMEFIKKYGGVLVWGNGITKPVKKDCSVHQVLENASLSWYGYIVFDKLGVQYVTQNNQLFRNLVCGPTITSFPQRNTHSDIKARIVLDRPMYFCQDTITIKIIVTDVSNIPISNYMIFIEFVDFKTNKIVHRTEELSTDNNGSAMWTGLPPLCSQGQYITVNVKAMDNKEYVLSSILYYTR